MKFALISKKEIRNTGYRVAETAAQPFEVYEDTLFWTECADNVEADTYWYDKTDNSIKLVPVIELPPIPDMFPTQG